MIMKKKVKIIAYYVSFSGAMQQKEWEVDTIDDAKAFIENKTDELERPIYGLSSTKKEEWNMTSRSSPSIGTAARPSSTIRTVANWKKKLTIITIKIRRNKLWQ